MATIPHWGSQNGASGHQCQDKAGSSHAGCLLSLYSSPKSVAWALVGGTCNNVRDPASLGAFEYGNWAMGHNFTSGWPGLQSRILAFFRPAG